MAAELDTLHEAIDGLAALVDGPLDGASLHAVVVAVQRERARLGVVAAQAICQWDGQQVWMDDGSRSPAARLARETSCSTTSARVELRRARHVEALPATVGAIERGELSLDHIDLLGRAGSGHRRELLERDEAVLAEECARLRFAPAVKVVQYWCQRADAETGHDDGAPPEDRATLHVNSTLDGAVAVNGVLDAVGGEIVTNELDRLEHDLYLADQRDGRVRTTSQRRAQALVVMATRSATLPAGGRAPKPLFTVLFGEGIAADLCELASGTVIHPRQLAPWLSTAMLESVLFDGPTTVISVSRKRSFTGAARRAVEVRDRTCQHPSGCDVPADRCDIDHTVPWSKGGKTSQFEGRPECSTHNRDHERHDHGATPLPEREITRLDELRARLRWRIRHYDPEDFADDPDDPDDPDQPDEPDGLLPRAPTHEPPGRTSHAS